ncbi:hypothetical protein D3C81_2081130 [compost metagenome]
MPDKSYGSQMQDDIWLQFGQQRAQARPIGQIGLTIVGGLQRLAPSPENFIATGP